MRGDGYQAYSQVPPTAKDYGNRYPKRGTIDKIKTRLTGDQPSAAFNACTISDGYKSASSPRARDSKGRFISTQADGYKSPHKSSCGCGK